MGVTQIGTTNIKASDLRKTSATNFDSGNTNTPSDFLGLNFMAGSVVPAISAPSWSSGGAAFKGISSSQKGFRTTTGSNTSKYRVIALSATNCQINLSYPTTNVSGIVWKPGSSPSVNGLHITAAETADGKKLFLPGIENGHTYSYITISLSNFSYGYERGTSYVWYTPTGGFVTAFQSPTNNSLTIYPNAYTSDSYFHLKHFAATI